MIGKILRHLSSYCKSKVAIAFALLFSFSNVLILFGQIPELSFRYLSKTEGLISSTVYDLLQDSTDHIWIATNNGLDKFDGYNFTHYNSDYNDSTTLISNRTQKLLIDQSGTLWVGTNMGLCFYNYELDQFVRISTPENRIGLESYNINEIAEDSKGNIYVLTDNIVYLYNKDTKWFSKFYTIENSIGIRLLFDYADNLWIGTNTEGLIRVSGKDSSVKKYKTEELPGSINSNSVFDIVEWKGKIWIATMGGGINILDPKTGKFEYVPVASSDEVYSIFLYVDNEYNLWSIDYTGLKIYSEYEKRFIGYYPDEKNQFSIKNSVRGIFQDMQGNYWTLFEPGGIGISTVPRGFSSFSTNPNNFYHVSDSKILSIQEDNDGNLWLGNASNGIDIFYWSQNQIRHYKNDHQDPYSLGQGAIQCIRRDRKNNMWISTYHTGLQLFDQKTEHFISFSNDPNDSNSIATNDIRCIYESQNGDLLLAVHGKGIDRFNVKTKKAKHYTNRSHGLSNDWTNDIIEDREGNIWVATAWGLSILPKGENKFKFYYSIQEDTNSISDSHVLCLLEDSKHNIWAGTINGLNLYNKEEDNFIRYNKDFESNYICSVLEDSDNNIWVTTQEGLSKLNISSKTIENFDVREGIRAGEFYVNSAYNNNINTLYFGGTNGVDIINTDKLIINNTAPKVIINSLKLFNEEITHNRNPEILSKSIAYTKKITLKHSQNVISIGYVALNHINPSKSNYAYKLEGFDQDWNHVGNKREAIYTNLDPKKYIFRVKASNNDNLWSKTGATIEIIILPPWYQTILFRIAVVLFAIALMFLITLLRTRQLEKTQSLLQRKVKEKTTELTGKNSILEEQSQNLKEAYSLLIERQHQLEEQSEEIKEQSNNLEEANQELQKLNATKDKLFSIIAHDLTSPFNTILGFSDLLIQSYDEMSEEERIRLANIINQSSVRVFSLLQNLLLWARSQTKRISYVPEKLELESIIIDTLDLLKAIYLQKRIAVNVSCPDDTQIFADLEMTKTIVRNILSNAIKFTPKQGSINLEVQKEQENVRITISDSGMGMSKETINTILSLEPVTPGEGTEGEKGTGLGLTICKDFLTMSHGELKITSEIGKGSNFSFTLPQAKKE